MGYFARLHRNELVNRFVDAEKTETLKTKSQKFPSTTRSPQRRRRLEPLINHASSPLSGLNGTARLSSLQFITFREFMGYT